jgi:uncharacterized protein
VAGSAAARWQHLSADASWRLDGLDPERQTRSVDELAPFVEAWRRRWAREARENAERAARARALAGELAEALRREFGVQVVWLIGSLARGDFGPGSDIDLVVEGLPPEKLFSAMARVQRLAGDFEVDLAPRGELREPARRALEREGVRL